MSSAGRAAQGGGASAARRAVEAFAQRYGAWPERVVRAPGRVNLIGEHVDYQDGVVLPLAIDRDVVLAVTARDDGRVAAVSEHEAEPVSVAVDPVGVPVAGWGRYVQGVAWALAGHGLQPVGFEGVVASDLPVGAGLSSSAALELAAALALLPAAARRPAPTVLARLAQRAETEWVGTSCGIMDQLTCASGVVGHVLRIDCRSLAVEPVPLPDDVGVLVLDTGTRRGLVASEYNARRADTERAARALGVGALRDAELEALAGADLSDETRARARHVITEIGRVERAVGALRTGDADAVGREMAASHASLRDDFGVVTPELDAIVEAAAAQPGCIGARMTGAGFGGCAVALVERARAVAVAEATARRYAERSGRQATVLACRPAAGAGDLDPAALRGQPVREGPP